VSPISAADASQFGGTSYSTIGGSILPLDSSLIDALSTTSFADFVNTFSDLQGSVGDVVGFSNVSSFALDEPMMLSHSMVDMFIQLEALYTLYDRGITSADMWVSDTTIDLSPYGDLWVSVCFETGNMNYYSPLEGDLIPVDIGFVPNDMETKEIRQALLAPWTVEHDARYLVRGLITPEPFNVPLVPDSQLRTNPFRSIARLSITWRTGAVDSGTAFLTSDRTAVTAAHVIFSASRGGTKQRGTITVAHNPNGSSHYPTRNISAIGWVDARWVQNQSHVGDQAIIVFEPNSFPTAPPLRLTIPTNIQGIGVSVTGYTRRNNTVSHSMHRWTGVVLNTENGLIRANYVRYSGMSGSPVMRLANTTDVIGIHSGYFPGGDARIVPVTTSLQNMLHTVNITHI